MNKHPMLNLNADMGESFGRYTVGDDAALIRVVQTANIACGFHAGDPLVMTQAVTLAHDHGASIGAHPSFQDLQGFGRRRMSLPAAEIEALVAYQIGALQGIASRAGTRVTHVKPHGALSNIAHTDAASARAIARAIRAVDHDLIFLAIARSEMVAAAEAEGLRVAHEIYADRTYEDDGSLSSRQQPGALITDPAAAVRQVLAFLDAGGIVTRSGKVLATPIHTICGHGDEPSGPPVMRAVHDALTVRGIQLVPLPALFH